MDGEQIDEATVEFIADGKELLEKTAEVAHDIEERVGRTLDYQPPPHAPQST